MPAIRSGIRLTPLRSRCLRYYQPLGARKTLWWLAAEPSRPSSRRASTKTLLPGSICYGYIEMIFHELWDIKSRNLVGSYETQEEALAVAARIIAEDPPSIDRLALEWGDDDDEDAGGLLAKGAKLAA